MTQIAIMAFVQVLNTQGLTERNLSFGRANYYSNTPWMGEISSVILQILLQILYVQTVAAIIKWTGQIYCGLAKTLPVHLVRCIWSFQQLGSIDNAAAQFLLVRLL